MAGNEVAGEVVGKVKRQRQEKLPNLKLCLVLLLTGAAILGSLLWDWIHAASNPVQIISGAGQDDLAVPPSTTDQDLTESSAAVNQNDMIPVYLVGSVKHPGVYQVARGSYLYELVDAAGGLTDHAARGSINLAFRIDTNQMIRLPSQDEVQQDPLQADPAVYPSESGDTQIDINRAALEELDSLPGVGPSTAQAIISYRDKNGPFKAIEELMKVPGIKESRFNALKDLICITG